ncbi:hypothetical protein WA158_004779 [Blastocystis sp. Blastoise]
MDTIFKWKPKKTESIEKDAFNFDISSDDSDGSFDLCKESESDCISPSNKTNESSNTASVLIYDMLYEINASIPINETSSDDNNDSDDSFTWTYTSEKQKNNRFIEQTKRKANIKRSKKEYIYTPPLLYTYILLPHHLLQPSFPLKSVPIPLLHPVDPLSLQVSTILLADSLKQQHDEKLSRSGIYTELSFIYNEVYTHNDIHENINKKVISLESQETPKKSINININTSFNSILHSQTIESEDTIIEIQEEYKDCFSIHNNSISNKNTNHELTLKKIDDSETIENPENTMLNLTTIQENTNTQNNNDSLIQDDIHLKEQENEDQNTKKNSESQNDDLWSMWLDDEQSD